MLNLEGIWTRYEDADAELQKIAGYDKAEATHAMQKIYSEPVKPELISQRIKEIKAEGVLAAASLTPQKVREHWQAALDAGLDVLVIQGTVVSAEHVSTVVEPLNLKEFIASLSGAGDRRRLCVVSGSAASDAHRRRRSAGGSRPGCGLHNPRRARGGSAAGDRHRRRAAPRARNTCWRPASM